MSNSLVPAFDIPVPADDLKFCGFALGKLPAVNGAKLALPVLRTMPPVIPKFEPEAVNVPATVVELPLDNTGVPVNVIPGFAAAMVEAKVAAFVVLVTVMAALAEETKVRAPNRSSPKLTIQLHRYTNMYFDVKRTTKP